MKNKKKFLAILMAISILLCSIIDITSSAANSIQGESELEIEELQPLMASGCYYHMGKPYVPEEANLVREDEGENTSTAFSSYVSRLGYVNGSWRYKMETWGKGFDTYECHYWYNSSYPNVYFYHS